MTETTTPKARTRKRGVDPDRAEEYRTWLRQMMLIRRFEEKAGEAYSLGKIGGFCHLYIGQEAVAVGSLAALGPDDYITCSYREHGHALVRGISARAVMAELFGKAAGCSGGKGGSMHLFDASLGFLGGHGIVGGHIPLSTGMAFAIKYRDTNQVAVCYFGEAAVNNGAFHEALNMAALWKLPCVYICENNRYGMGTALERASAIYDISERACSYDMANEVVDGQDVLVMHAAMERAVQRARADKQPDAARCAHVPLHGPLDVRPDPRPLSDPGRGRGPAQARSDRGLVAAADRRGNHGRGGGAGDGPGGRSPRSRTPISSPTRRPTRTPEALYTDVYAEK